MFLWHKVPIFVKSNDRNNGLSLYLLKDFYPFSNHQKLCNAMSYLISTYRLRSYFVSLVSMLFLGLLAGFFALQHNQLYASSDQEVDLDLDRLTHVDTLLNQSASNLFTYPDSVKRIARDGIRYGARYDRQDMEVKSLNILGKYYGIQSEYDSALYYFYRGQALAADMEDYEVIGDFFNNIGLVNWQTGNYKGAISSMLEALDYYDKTGIDDSRANILNNLGLIYVDLHNYEKGREYFHEAREKNERHNDLIGLGASLNNLGFLYLTEERFDSAFHYLNKSIDLNSDLNAYYDLCISYGGKAEAYLAMASYPDALHYFNKSKDLARNNGFKYEETTALQGLARTYLAREDMGRAQTYIREAMEIASDIENLKLAYQGEKILSDIFNASGDYQQALEHYHTYTELKEELINQNKLHQVYNLMLSHSTQQRIEEIDQLSKEKEIQELEIQRQELMLSRKNTTIILIVLTFLLIMTGGILFYHRFKYKQKERLQRTVINLTEKKSRAAVESELKERERIGRELHDGLGQMLSATRLNISVLQQKAALSEERKKELLGAAINSVDIAFSELRHITQNLAPSVLTDKGFDGALSHLRDQINSSGRIKVQYATYGLNGKLDPLIEHTLYRAIQELLNNAIKHAGASHFNFQIVQGDDEVTLLVEDNGLGFDPNENTVQSGGGLKNIKARIENLNGSIYFDSMKQRGTIVTIVIPLHKAEKYVGKAYSSIDY